MNKKIIILTSYKAKNLVSLVTESSLLSKAKYTYIHPIIFGTMLAHSTNPNLISKS